MKAKPAQKKKGAQGHRLGYQAHPVEKDEFGVWVKEQAWPRKSRQKELKASAERSFKKFGKMYKKLAG